MRGFNGGTVDRWRGITAVSMVVASVAIAAVLGVMAMLILHQDN